MRFIDPDGMSAQDVETYTTNDGTTVSYDVNTQKTLGYDTSTQEGGNGDEKEKNKGQTSSSTLDEKRPQLNLNDPTNHVIFFMDQRDEDDPTRLIDDVLAFFNPFKALEGLLLAKMNPFAKTNAVNHLITSIAKKYDNFKCMECADEIVETLKARGIKGEILEVVTKSNKGHSGNIWSDAANKNISINGRHKAILVEGKVYDNVNPNGLDYTKWVNDLFSPSGHTIKKTTF
jgi:hypothetical protein